MYEIRNLGFLNKFPELKILTSQSMARMVSWPAKSSILVAGDVVWSCRLFLKKKSYILNCESYILSHGKNTITFDYHFFLLLFLVIVPGQRPKITLSPESL